MSQKLEKDQYHETSIQKCSCRITLGHSLVLRSLTDRNGLSLNMTHVCNVKNKNMWCPITRPFVLQCLGEDDDDDEARPLAESLLLAIADLLFCPDFTAQRNKRNPVSSPRSGTFTSQIQSLIHAFSKALPQVYSLTGKNISVKH